MHNVSLRVWTDLADIWEYIARDNPDAADRTVEGLEEKFLLLGQFPELGRERKEYRGRLRSLAVGSYVIFYRVSGADADIVRVLHGSQNLKQILG